MLVPLNIGEDHKALSVETHCEGYTNMLGIWVADFTCPPIGEQAVFCCGGDSHRYCCTSRDQNPYMFRGPALPLLFVTAIGTAITFIALIVAALVLCMSSRKVPMTPKTGTPMYRMASPSTASGMANIYSCSYDSLGKADPCRTPQMLPFSRSEATFGSGSHLMGVSVSQSTGATGVQTMPRSFGTSKEKVSRVSFVDTATADVVAIVDTGAAGGAATLHATRGHPADPHSRYQMTSMATFPRSAPSHATALPLSEFLPAQVSGNERSTKF